MIINEDVYERCFEKHKKGNRFQAVMKTDLVAYLKSIDETVTSKMTKTALIELAYQHLTPDTVEDFTRNLEGFGLTIYDVMDLFGISQYQARKLVKQGRLEKNGTMYGDTNRYAGERKTYFMYSIPSIIRVNEEGIEEKAYDIEPTDENLASALYLINKSAKISRDTKWKAYDDGKHGVCHAAKTRSENLYDLKDRAMKKLISEGRMTYVGINDQTMEGVHIAYLDQYVMGEFSFHIPPVLAKWKKRRSSEK